MSHRIPTKFGWLTAEVHASGSTCVARLVDHHPSLDRVAAASGASPEEALEALAAAVQTVSGTAAAAAARSRAGGDVVPVVLSGLRRVLRLHGSAVENAAGAVVDDACARRHRETVASQVQAMVVPTGTQASDATTSDGTRRR